MPLLTFATGPYATTYNATGVGVTKDGFRLTHEMKDEVIQQSDLYGDSTLDIIRRGGNVFCAFTLIEFTKGTPVLGMWTAGSLFQLWTSTYPIGRLASDLTTVLVMTAQANTPAASVSGAYATITANKAVLAPNFSAEHLYDSRLRELPLRMQFLPYSSTGTVIFGTTT